MVLNLQKYVPQDNPSLLRLLTIHSRCVAQKSLDIARRLQSRGIDVDTEFIYQAAMLHDIGIVSCDAPSIYCYGSQPYIRHGIIGAETLRAEGLPRHALVCERHTGAGLTLNDIISQNLPLPHHDYCPLSIEEKIICYADKFFSKSKSPETEIPLPTIRAKMEAHGPDTLARFDALHNLFKN